MKKRERQINGRVASQPLVKLCALVLQGKKCMGAPGPRNAKRALKTYLYPIALYTENMDIRVSRISNVMSNRHPDTPLAKGLHECLVLFCRPIQKSCLKLKF